MSAKVVFTTMRSPRHQRTALAAAPPDLQVIMLADPTPNRLREQLADADYLISERSGLIDAALLQTAPRLRLIQRLGSLTYDIDLAAAQAAEVAVCRWPLRQVIRVAEHVVLQILTLVKHVRESEAALLNGGPDWSDSQKTDANTFAYNWTQQQQGGSLYEKTVGIIGFGEIGAELARRLAGWGCTLHYHKRHRLPEAVERDYGMGYASLDDLLRTSEVLVNLLPLSPQTEGLLNAARLAQLPPGAILVSVGSGGILDEAALAALIRSGRLHGAALDTFAWEPIQPDNPLLSLVRAGANALLTPHIAAGYVPDPVGDCREFYENIRRDLAGEPLLHRLI